LKCPVSYSTAFTTAVASFGEHPTTASHCNHVYVLSEKQPEGRLRCQQLGPVISKRSAGQLRLRAWGVVLATYVSYLEVRVHWFAYSVRSTVLCR
jgi:hypothetical protein